MHICINACFSALIHGVENDWHVGLCTVMKEVNKAIKKFCKIQDLLRIFDIITLDIIKNNVHTIVFCPK